MENRHLIAPKIEILPEPQKVIWKQLIQIPKEFVLYGGTALALYLGHRESVDFDFFTFQSFDVDKILNKVPLLKNARVIQKEENTLTCILDMNTPVQISFFGLPQLKATFEPLNIKENNIKIASLLDISGMKVSVVQKRAEYKDYFDIYSMIDKLGLKLSMMLSMGVQIYGSQFNPQISLKALSFFEDGDLIRLKEGEKKLLIDSILKSNLDNLPSFEDLEREHQILLERFSSK